VTLLALRLASGPTVKACWPSGVRNFGAADNVGESSRPL